MPLTETADFRALRRQIMERDFSRMNSRQQEAVFHANGPLLILAGAGSGKTTVLVNRAASLIRYGEAYESEETPLLSDIPSEQIRLCAEGKREIDGSIRKLLAVSPCRPWQILTITFTNKAAGELKDRLCAMLGSEGEEIVACTFHSFCARILRRDGEALGYDSHFTIYDTQDSARLMKDCLKTLGVAEHILGHKAVLSEISRAKDTLCSPEEFRSRAGGDLRLRQIAACFELYERRLKQANALDFDDLLCQTVALFERFPDILDKYRRRFRYIMVDEYQDTNYAQYRLISLLSGAHRNLCVVGDDDQSIYTFRGATVENILGFEEEFPSCRVIRLEQNYRSTKTILDAANHVIEKNLSRKGKTLWTENGQGEPIDLYILDDEDEEAGLIADTVQNGVAFGRKYRDYAVLYRARAQSNAIERVLIKSGIPYRVIGGHRFFDTQEVRDAMAYLRVIQNPEDDVSLRRIINLPRRAIGETTMEHAAEIASGLGLSLYEVIQNASSYPAISRAAGKMSDFAAMLDSLREMSGDGHTLPHELYREMLNRSGYLAMWEAAGEAEEGRVENLNELESSLIDYEKHSAEEVPSLAGFLEEASLMTDVDNYDAGADTVVLMTMHAAKGLEFPVVFLPGFEEGIFPGRNSLFDSEEMEEERRLCYVGITRAKERLILCRTRRRMLYGSTNRNGPSRFLSDIPGELILEHDLTSEGAFAGSYSAYTGRAAQIVAEAERDAAVRSARRVTSAGADRPRRTDGHPHWAVGDRVRHPVFGHGVITGASAMGNDMMLTVAFDKAGTKKIMANFARMEKENSGEAE